MRISSFPATGQRAASLVLFSILFLNPAFVAWGANKHSRPSTPPRTALTIAAAQSQPPPPMVRNGQPGEMHKRLDALVGEWDVEVKFYIAGGTAEKPLIANDLICRREWIAETGNRHLRDVTQGTVAGDPYYRLGILSYATMDRRYEWNTVDALNAGMMTYKGAKGSARATGDIVMTGEFTDQGLLGDGYAGKNIGQRTVIKIETSDRHVFDMYFKPPGEKERLAAHGVYTRRK
jgi:hypothetical protein